MSCDDHCDCARWEIIGLALLENRPERPLMGALTSGLCMFSGASGFFLNKGPRLWGDAAVAVIGLALGAWLSLRYRAQMRTWNRGVASYRKMTGKMPGEELS